MVDTGNLKKKKNSPATKSGQLKCPCRGEVWVSPKKKDPKGRGYLGAKKTRCAIQECPSKTR